MSAEVLREAARLMRERAEGATSGPWSMKLTHDRHWMLVTNGDPECGVAARCADDDDADHIASWHPAVALAVADWLEKSARHASAREDGGMDANESADPRALAVANAYLGNPTPPTR